MEFSRKALSDMLALKPYWGKPAVRNFRGGDGDVGIIRSPVRAIALLDHRGTETQRKSCLCFSVPLWLKKATQFTRSACSAWGPWDPVVCRNTAPPAHP